MPLLSRGGCRQAEQVRRELGLGKDRTLFYRRLDEVRLVCLDLETTGLCPERGDEIIAFGAVAIEGGQIVWESCVQRLFNPGRPIPPAISRLTGITNAMVQDEPGFGEAIPQVVARLGRAILLGHCLHFDLAFLNRKIKARYQCQVVHPTLDLRELARLLYPDLGGYSLDRILTKLGLAGRYRRHSALGDALATAEAFLLLLNDLAARGIYSLADLQDYRLYQRFTAGVSCTF